MIELTAEQEDALIEIGNIGMSKAAKQLSVLLNSPIKITIPKIAFIPFKDIAQEGTFDLEQVYTLVSQKVSDDLEGCSALVFRREHANLLTLAVIGVAPEFTQKEARAYEQEAMLEIGNVIITSCISVITKMVSKTVDLSLPTYNEDKLLDLLGDLFTSMQMTNQNLIAISTKLETQEDNLTGHLFLILTEQSINKLLDSIRKLTGDEN